MWRNHLPHTFPFELKVLRTAKQLPCLWIGEKDGGRLVQDENPIGRKLDDVL